MEQSERAAVSYEAENETVPEKSGESYMARGLKNAKRHVILARLVTCRYKILKIIGRE